MATMHKRRPDKSRTAQGGRALEEVGIVVIIIIIIVVGRGGGSRIRRLYSFFGPEGGA